jgi:hypothetical protein
MIHTTVVALPPEEVLARAQAFFADRVPHVAAFVEQQGPRFVVLRGQGGEEVVFSAWTDGGGKTRVRASTLFFDQAVDRFFSTLPLEAPVEVA